MKFYTKEINGRIEVEPRNAIVVIKDGRQILNPSEEDVLTDGWVEYIPYTPTKEELEKRRKRDEIEQYKNMLSESDYRVIKCMEAYLCGEELPYDIHALHSDRNAQRETINSLEESV